ncbi:MAG TPA: translation initiation factor IF-3 [Patescibacteria group bacterium]|nr:translation initiation factor IF-3 [Patescibacteria group bacterium]
MIKKHKYHNPRRIYRINERIFAHTLRVIDSEGKQIGVISKFDAISKARNLGLDLVEIAPMAKPPVAKIVDFNKFLYQEEKKKREEKRKAKVSETKEVRLGPFMSDNDLQVMIRRAREFLEEGNKVRLVLKFRGRQITHPEFGNAIIGKTVEALDDISKVDREAHFEGKQLIALLSAERKKSSVAKAKENNAYGQEKNQGLSVKEVQSNEERKSAV